MTSGPPENVPPEAIPPDSFGMLNMEPPDDPNANRPRANELGISSPPPSPRRGEKVASWVWIVISSLAGLGILVLFVALILSKSHSKVRPVALEIPAPIQPKTNFNITYVKAKDRKVTFADIENTI